MWGRSAAFLLYTAAWGQEEVCGMGRWGGDCKQKHYSILLHPAKSKVYRGTLPPLHCGRREIPVSRLFWDWSLHFVTQV